MAVEIIATPESLSLYGNTGPIEACLIATYGYFCLTEEGDYVPNITEISLSRLIEQYRSNMDGTKGLKEADRTDFQKIIAAFTEELQELEDVYFNLYTLRQLPVAGGQHLDNCGEIVGEDRNGRDDETYRSAIYARIIINQSSGTIEDMILATKTLTNATLVQVIEQFPAGMSIYTNGSETPEDVLSTIDSSAAGGVSVDGLTVGYGQIAFGFGDQNGDGFPEDDENALGFSELNYQQDDENAGALTELFS